MADMKDKLQEMVGVRLTPNDVRRVQRLAALDDRTVSYMGRKAMLIGIAALEKEMLK